MNNAPLPRAHGGPLRIVVPEFPGAAWQKWLSRVEIRDCEHDGPKMTGLDYRLPARPVEPGMAFEEFPFEVIEDLPVQALITAPAEGAGIRHGAPAEIRGWAWSGHTPVEAVGLSIDDGASWSPARLESSPDRWAWRRFRWAWTPPRAGPATIIARATDRDGRSQPLAQIWNPRGYCNNACQRLAVTVI